MQHKNSKPWSKLMRTLAALFVANLFLIGAASTAVAADPDAAFGGLVSVPSYHLAKGETRTVTDDLVIIADGDIIIDGNLIAAQPSEAGADGFSITLVSLDGDVVVTGLISASSGVPGAAVVDTGDVYGQDGGDAGDVSLFAANGFVSLTRSAQLIAGQGGRGADAANPFESRAPATVVAGDGGAAGIVRISGDFVESSDALVTFGDAVNGGNAYSVETAYGGIGGAAGVVMVQAGDSTHFVDRGFLSWDVTGFTTTFAPALVPRPDLDDLSPLPTQKGYGCEYDQSVTGEAGTNNQDAPGGTGGNACSIATPNTDPQADPGSAGKNDTTPWGKCSHGGDAPDGTPGGDAAATGGMGGTSFKYNGGNGGNGESQAAPGQKGGQGGKGGNAGIYGNGCDGGDGGNGGSNGLSVGKGGMGGTSSCAAGGSGGTGTASTGSVGGGGTGGAPGTGGASGASGDPGDPGDPGVVVKPSSGIGDRGGDGNPLDPACHGVPPVGGICDTTADAMITDCLDEVCGNNACDVNNPCETRNCDVGNPCEDIRFFANLDTSCIPPVDLGIVQEIVDAVVGECDFAYFETLTIADVCNGDVGGPDLGPLIQKLTRNFEAFA